MSHGSRVRVFLSMVAVLLLSPNALQAHAIHTTLTVLTLTGGDVTFTVRSFADDFSASVARFAGRSAPRDSSVRAGDVMRYIQAQFVVRDAEGHVLPLLPCGVKRQRELYFACFRAAAPRGMAGLRVVNRMLTELHADQVNIVQVEGRGPRRTLLFTRASAPAELSSRS